MPNEENIRGLDIAVNDSLPVRSVQRSGHLNPDLQQFVQRDSSLRDAVLQRLAFQKFHYQEMLALVFINVVNDANIWMVQCGGRACFPTEALDGMGIARSIVRQEFQRDQAAEFCVFGGVHHAHSAAAELFHDAVMRNRCSTKWA